MTKKTVDIVDALDLTVPDFDVVTTALPAVVGSNLPVEHDPTPDSEKAQRNLSKIVDIGMNALEQIAAVAIQSQDSDAYESLASIMRVMIAGNDKLAKLSSSGKGHDEGKGATFSGGQHVHVTAEDLRKSLKR